MLAVAATAAVLLPCVPRPFVNDTCASATGLTTTASVPLLFSSASTSSGFGATSLAGGLIHRDVFYQFVPPLDGGYVFVLDMQSTEQRVAGYDAPGCAGNLIAEGGASMRIDGLTAGQPILLQLGGDVPSFQGFADLLIYHDFYVGGQSCDNAPLLPGPGTYMFPQIDNGTVNLLGSPACSPSSISPADRGFFRFDVPTDGDYRFSAEMSSAIRPIGVYLGTDCNATCIVSANDATVIVPHLTAGEQLLISVGTETPFHGNTGVLEIGLAPQFEGDTCSNPIAITSFEQFLLSMSGATTSGLPTATCDPSADLLFQDVFFSFTPPTSGTYSLRGELLPFITGTQSEIRLFEGNDCSGPCLDRDASAQATVLIPARPAGTTFTVQIGAPAPFTVSELESLRVTIGVTPTDPCALVPPDGFEPNDSCLGAPDVGTEVIGGLTLTVGDRDYYRARVFPGETILATLTQGGPIDWSALFLLSAGPPCGTQYAGMLAPVTLDSAIFPTLTYNVSWTNPTNRLQDVFILAEEDPFFQDDDCWTYALDVSGAAPVGTIGQSYCTGTTNSTGSVATTGAFGSSIAADKDVTLTADSMPPSTFGIFLVSQTRDSNPAWNNGAGTLCLAEPIGRINTASSVLQADSTGRFEQALNLSAIPLGGTLLTVAPGDTLHFAAWYRDILGGGASSNLTEGFTIWFE